MVYSVGTFFKFAPWEVLTGMDLDTAIEECRRMSNEDTVEKSCVFYGEEVCGVESDLEKVSSLFEYIKGKNIV